MRRRDFIAAIGGSAGLAWPRAAAAQQRGVPVIGYLAGGGSENSLPQLAAAFRRGLSEQGYVDGRNVTILRLSAETRNERLPALAAELVRRQVALIFATGGTELAAKAATNTTPIVFSIGGDPVALGLIASLNHPGGNATGATYLAEELAAKRLELLHESVPQVATIGYLTNPSRSQAEAAKKQVEGATRILGLRLTILNASNPSEIETAFASLADRRIGAMIMGDGDPLFFTQTELLAALSARYKVPAIHYLREFSDAGGLMSYGPSVADTHRIAGNYAGRILKGEKPGDLPVQQSTRIEMVLNLKTAKALGLDVPTSILLRADEVIE